MTSSIEMFAQDVGQYRMVVDAINANEMKQISKVKFPVIYYMNLNA